MSSHKPSPNDEAYTPREITNALSVNQGKVFDLDPCAAPREYADIATRNYRFSEGEDGLMLPWNGFIWLNPPFSNKGPWIQKFLCSRNGILLLPASTESPWFGPLAAACGHGFFMGKKPAFKNAGNNPRNNICLFLPNREAIDRVENSGLVGTLVGFKYHHPRNPNKKKTYINPDRGMRIYSKFAKVPRQLKLNLAS